MTADQERFVVAGCKPWNRRVFDDMLTHFDGDWVFVETPDELDATLRIAPTPRFVFFLHWSWIVPEQVVETFECVNFHMTDLPFGRGGSPLQNLIALGHEDTVMTAFRMTRGLDEGPVYLKRPFSLGGGAEEIYIRSSRLCAEMIHEILKSRSATHPQKGEVTVFRRRKPAESAVPSDLRSLREIYDRIRMVDAEGYPRAFIRFGAFTLTFRRAALYDGKVVADVEIKLEEDR